MIKKFLFMLMVLPVFAFADYSHKGEAILRHLWKDIKEKNIEAIKKHTIRDFQGVHFWGATNRCSELNYIKRLNIMDYRLLDIKVTKKDDVLIITYKASINRSKPFERLSTFKKVKHHWKWSSHANFEIG